MKENGLVICKKRLPVVFLLLCLTLLLPLNTKAASVSCQNAMVVEEDETISDTTFEKDIYINKDVTLITTGAVTVDGNVYVWGTLRNTGTLTVNGNLYCLHYGSMFSAGNYDYGYFTNSGSAKVTGLIVKDDYLSAGIPTITHTGGLWEVTKEATCTTDGEQVQKCLYCEEILNTSTIAATGHSYDSGTVTKAATATTSGIKTYTCKNCGATKTEMIPATGSDKKSTDGGDSETGTNDTNSSGSSNTGTIDTDNAASSDSSSSDSTSVKLKKGSSYTVGSLIYKITSLPASGTGAVTLTKPAKTSITTATIPATVKIGGRSFKVTKIASKAFKGCKKLKSVTIGKNVTTIGSQAFYGCTKMTKVTIKTGTTKIGKKAFYNCKKLKTITIKSKKLKTVGSNAFKGINSKATITVPKSKLSAYKKLLKGKGQGTKVKIVKS